MEDRGASWWQKLFGLEAKAPPVQPPPVVKAAPPRSGEWEPPGRPGHSMTGEIVTDIEPDWGRYDDCRKINVVGESFYQPALIAVSLCPPGKKPHGYECSAELVLEPDNPEDKYAVRVEIEGELVGYLPRGTAKRLGKRLRGLAVDGRPAICMAYVGRGPDNPNLGVVLRLPYSGEILQGYS
jgi:hypothetical protein